MIDGTATPALVLTATGLVGVAVAARDHLTIVVAGHAIEPGALRLSPIPPTPLRCSDPQRPDVKHRPTTNLAGESGAWTAERQVALGTSR